jgi:hypothetical protein
MTAADFYAKSTTAIENKNGCLLMVDGRCSLLPSARHIVASHFLEANVCNGAGCSQFAMTASLPPRPASAPCPMADGVSKRHARRRQAYFLAGTTSSPK